MSNQDPKEEVVVKKTALETLNERMKESMVKQHVTAADKVVEEAAKVKVDEYAGLLARSMKKLDELHETWKKIRPDNVAPVDEDGKKIGTDTYKPETQKKKKAAKDKFVNLDKAVIRCLDLSETSSYQDLVSAYGSLDKALKKG